jgi:hypothetical protein
MVLDHLILGLLLEEGYAENVCQNTACSACEIRLYEIAFIANSGQYMSISKKPAIQYLGVRCSFKTTSDQSEQPKPHCPTMNEISSDSLLSPEALMAVTTK